MKFKLKCFNVETIKFNRNGTEQIRYKVWFNLSSGVGFLVTNKLVTAGSELEVEVFPTFSKDIYTNMTLGLRIV